MILTSILGIIGLTNGKKKAKREQYLKYFMINTRKQSTFYAYKCAHTHIYIYIQLCGQMNDFLSSILHIMRRRRRRPFDHHIP